MGGVDPQTPHPAASLRRGLLVDEDGVILHAAEDVSVILGLPHHDLVGTRFSDYVREQDRVIEAARNDERRDGVPTMYDLHVRRPDGSHRFVQICAVPLEQHEGGAVVKRARMLIRDITQPLVAPDTILREDGGFRRALEAMPFGVAIYSIDGHISFVNRAAGVMLGAERPSSLVGRKLEEIIPPRSIELIRARQRARSLGYDTEPLELEIARVDGKARIVRGHSAFLTTDPVTLLTVFDDVTARKQMELALRESETRYRELFDNAPEAIFWLKVEPERRYVIERVNPSCEKFLRTTQALILGKTIDEVLIPERAALALDVLDHCYSSRRPCSVEQEIPLSPRRRSMSLTVVPVLGEDGEIERMFGIARDITELKHQEEVLRQAQKLESLGVLAGGIAHDFNNLLTAIVGNLHLARRAIPNDSPAIARLDNIAIASQRAADLTRQMLAYSGRGKLVVTTVDLNVLVHEITHLLSVSISKKASLRCDLDPALPRIKADPTQLQQVVMNLVTNASDAIGDANGTISLVTRPATLSDEQIASMMPNQSVSPGSFACVEVSDDGCGMSADTLSKIFDPFFTTKSVVAVLRLSAMQGILRGHRAGIHISSTLGKGSMFRVYFPAVEVTPHIRRDLRARKTRPSIAGRSCSSMTKLSFEV
ncbi:MAG: PAS domain S-box protein [Polyangiaceae bacterium]